MNISESLYWRLIQGELRCPTCRHFIPETKDKTMPCVNYVEFEGSMDCPFRECSTSRPYPVE